MTPSPREHVPMLAAMARNAERANRPLTLLAACALLLAASLVFALAGLGASRNDKAAYRRQVDLAAETQRLAADINNLRASLQASPETDAYARFGAILSRIDDAAKAAGLEPTPQVSLNTEQTKDSPLVRQVVQATVRGHTADKVFDWMQRVVRDVPGSHVTQLVMRPSREGWEITVRFARWELPA